MKLNELLKQMEDSSWVIKYSESKNDIYSMVPKERYPNIPLEYIEFFCNLNICMDKTDKDFFLLIENHSSKAEDVGFSWNFCENLSLEYSSSEKETNEIISFWDKYLPIALSVSSDYAVYSINLKDDVGAVYYTYAPMFQEGITKVSDTFHDFLKLICEPNYAFSMGFFDEDEDAEIDEEEEIEETEEEKALFAEIDAEIAADEAALEEKKKKKKE